MTGARFSTTQWSLVLAAGAAQSSEGEAALARLCTLYWYPLFAFVRRQGHSADEAEDLTQAFFARLIEKGDISDADRSRGRFRSFLLASCKHFLSNQRDRERTLKRGGGHEAISIDVAAAEARYQRALAHDETPERLYDRQWTLTLLETVVAQLKEEYAANGNVRLFDALRPFITGDGEGDAYASVAAGLDMSEGAVKVAVHRLRRRYREALREHVADTVGSLQEVDDEMRYLLASVV